MAVAHHRRLRRKSEMPNEQRRAGNLSSGAPLRLRRCSARGYPVAGRSELKMSRMIFQEPSG